MDFRKQSLSGEYSDEIDRIAEFEGEGEPSDAGENLPQIKNGR